MSAIPLSIVLMCWRLFMQPSGHSHEHLLSSIGGLHGLLWFFFQFYLSFVPFNLCVALSSSRAVLRTILIKKNYDDDDIQHNIIFKMVSQAKLHAQFTIAGQLKVN